MREVYTVDYSIQSCTVRRKHLAWAAVFARLTKIIWVSVPYSGISLVRHELELKNALKYELHSSAQARNCAGIFKQSMGARNRVGMGLSYRPTRVGNFSPAMGTRNQGTK
jgi:hypothetical protein